MAMRGYLDSILSSGFVEGWAYDDDAPQTPLTISVLNGTTESARAIANLFRGDLADAKCGTGWCAFRARLEINVEQARGLPLALVDATSGNLIQPPRVLQYREEEERPIASIADVIAHDPTRLEFIAHLKGYGNVFNEFVKDHGAEAFVRTAYSYVLSRGADFKTVRDYGGMIGQGLLEPFGLLLILAESEEFRSTPRHLAVPGATAFPFPPA